ncbi:MAG: His/Gly/Thr/Pro-type tRNA ligase C-terminal domain-containing protein [Bifidobacteriales bacterium]|nr:His/Gly/Thr/Pro-type tRNA ligase C-terminal domain-containing protein [Bifidobacteriales bacterium]
MGDTALLKAASLACTLRDHGFSLAIETRGNMKKRMDRVVQSGASHVLFLGDDDLARDVVQLRHLATREQEEVPIGQLVEALERARNS